jgi:hypothetical protein
MPEQITQASVNEVKKQVKATWKSFTTAEKEQIATTPGMWICLRTELNNADKAQQDKIRSSLAKLSPDATPAPAKSDVMINNTQLMFMQSLHSAQMACQQLTYNNYMWSMGYNYGVYGKNGW